MAESMFSKSRTISKGGRTIRRCQICGSENTGGNFQRHVIRNHIAWIFRLWEDRHYLRLFWLGRSLDGYLGRYLEMYAAHALANQPLPEPFDPKNYKMKIGVGAAFQEIGWPRQNSTYLTGECTICLDPDVPTMPLHVVEAAGGERIPHKFCLDCLSRVESGTPLFRQSLSCPICREEVPRATVVKLVEDALATAQVDAAVAHRPPSVETAMENLVDYEPPRQDWRSVEAAWSAQHQRPQASGWISRRRQPAPVGGYTDPREETYDGGVIVQDGTLGSERPYWPHVPDIPLVPESQNRVHGFDHNASARRINLYAAHARQAERHGNLRREMGPSPLSQAVAYEEERETREAYERGAPGGQWVVELDSGGSPVARWQGAQRTLGGGQQVAYGPSQRHSTEITHQGVRWTLEVDSDGEVTSHRHPPTVLNRGQRITTTTTTQFIDLTTEDEA